MLWPMYIWNTYTKLYIIFQFTLRPLILDDLSMSNKDHRNFNMLYLINSASYNQSLYETHIVSHIWRFSLPYKIWPWMTLKGQIKVIEFSAGCFHKRSMLWLKLIRNASVYLKIFELLWPLKVKLSSHYVKCNIAMSYSPIALQFCTEVHYK